MKFRTLLTEATMMKRTFRFLMDVELKNNKKRTLYCPNLGLLPFCEIPGTKVWFRTANRLSQGYLDVLELIELNASIWIAVNVDYAGALVREAAHQGIITELRDYRFLHLNTLANRNDPTRNIPNKINPELLIKENGDRCFIHIIPVLSSNESGTGFFPESASEEIYPLNELMHQKETGARAILFLAVQNTGVNCLRPADQLHPNFCSLLRKASKAGVEIIAYRANINLREISLETRIPVLISEYETGG